MLNQEELLIDNKQKSMRELLRLASGRITFRDGKFILDTKKFITSLQKDNYPDLNQALDTLVDKFGQGPDLLSLGLLFALQPSSNRLSHRLVESKDPAAAKKLTAFAEIVENITDNQFLLDPIKDDLALTNQPENDFFLPNLTHNLLKAVFEKVYPEDTSVNYHQLLNFARQNPDILTMVYALEKISLVHLSYLLARSPAKSRLYVNIDPNLYRFIEMIFNNEITAQEIGTKSIKDLAATTIILTVENWLRGFSKEGVIECKAKNGQWNMMLPEELSGVAGKPVVFLESLPSFFLPVGFSVENPSNPRLNFSLVADHPDEPLGYISTDS